MAVKLPLPAMREIDPRMSPYSPMSPELHLSDFSSSALEDDGTAGKNFIITNFGYK